MDKTFHKIVLGVGTFIMVTGVMAVILGPSEEPASFNNVNLSAFHSSHFFELREAIEKSITQVELPELDEAESLQIGITSHHLPTALPLISKFYQTLLNTDGPRDVFVILGPDHWERGHTSVSTSLHSFVTPFGVLEAETGIIDDLLSSGVAIDNEALEAEHSIGVQTIFIKLFFPEAKIVPLVLRASTDEKDINHIVQVLAKYKEKITVVASVDFSHYRPYQEARVLDQESKEMLEGFDFDSFNLEHCDSPAVLKIIGKFTSISGATKVKVLDLANSYDFTRARESTTGYINAVIGEKGLFKETTLMFVGDIMLSRAVGQKMRGEENFRWPFEEIKEYLGWADLLFGNLECPVTVGRPIRSGEMVFRADPEVVQGLKWAGFDVLSLANNHTPNWGQQGLKDTFKNLDDAGISYVGAGVDITQALEPKVLEVDGIKIAFLAFNDSDVVPVSYQATDTRAGTAFMRTSQMKEKVGEAKEKADLVVVSMHSGTEYAYQPNNRQINFTQSAIEAGADLVVGHHPHVIQKTEKYKDGWVAYSLGNFVFDQNFSEPTRRGQILEVTLEEGEIKKVKTIDIRINDFYQPELIFK